MQVKTQLIYFHMPEIRSKQKYMLLKCFILSKTALSDNELLCENKLVSIISARIIPFVYYWLSFKQMLLPDPRFLFSDLQCG